MSPDDLIGTVDAADILDVTQRTVKRMALRGDLPTVTKMTGKTGAYLFRRGDVEAFAAERATIVAESKREQERAS